MFITIVLSVVSAQVPPPWDVASVYTRNVFISPAGNDATGAGTLASPWATLTRAFQGASPGTKVRTTWFCKRESA